MTNLNKGDTYMEIRDLQNFVKVVQAGSFTKAAEQTFVSQPSLSKSIKRLEQELDVELLERSTRFIRLTEEGKVVFEQSKKAIRAIDEIQLHLNDLRHVHRGTIKIGIPPLIGTLFFPTLARAFHEKYPNVLLELHEHGAKLVGPLVDEGIVNLGFVVLPTNDRLFDIRSFIEDEFVLFIHQDHPLAQKDKVSIKELKNEAFIIFSEEFTLHDVVIQACNKAGFIANVAYKSSQWDLIVELVASQLGITLLPKSIFDKQNNKNIKMIPIEEELYWKLAIITKKDGYLPFSVMEFLNFAQQQPVFNYSR